MPIELVVADNYYLTATPYFVTVPGVPRLSPLGTAVMTEIDTDVGYPIFPANTIIEYQNLDNDPQLRRKMMRYFYQKFLNYWIHDDFSALLGYFVVKDSKVKPISTLNSYRKTRNESKREVDAIVAYLAKYYVTKERMKKMLHTYIAKSRTHWYDLRKNKELVKEALFKRVKYLIKEDIIHGIKY